MRHPLRPAHLLLPVLLAGCGGGVCLWKQEFPDDPHPTRYGCREVPSAQQCDEDIPLEGRTDEWVPGETCPDLGYGTDCGSDGFYAGPDCERSHGVEHSTWNVPGHRVAGDGQGDSRPRPCGPFIPCL